MRVLISDIRDGDEVDVQAVRNYYPYGMLRDNQTTTFDGHRYGFNGMEMDNELNELPMVKSGIGNSYTTLFRQYDPRLGRWLSVDPEAASFPDVNPYIAFGDNPVMFVDLLGIV